MDVCVDVLWKTTPTYQRVGYGWFRIRLFGSAMLTATLNLITSVILPLFGILREESLLSNILAPDNCVSYRNIFRNGVDPLSKIADAFLSKAQNFI